MEFKCLGTSSLGNCYLVKTDGSTILLDAGIKLQNIVKEVNLNDLSFAFISHCHKDHSECQEKLEKKGVQIVDGAITKEWRKNQIKREFRGNFYTFGVEHGDTTCNGCIIETKEDTILYITDFNLCKWDLSFFKFTSVIVECNYQESKISQALIDSDVKIKRQINTHMGLEGLELFLDSLDLTKCKEIILVHQSHDLRLIDEYETRLHIFGKYLIPTGTAQIYGGVEWTGKDVFEIE